MRLWVSRLAARCRLGNMDPYAPYNIPALGQPMYPGYLFNCRNVVLMQQSPWTDEQLKEGTQIQSLRHSSIEFTSNDSKEERKRELGLTASWGESLLGLIGDSGSASFYYANEKEQNTFRMVAHAKLTLVSKSLKPDLLNNIPKSSILKQASHMIAGGVYGGQCFFVCDREYGRNEDKAEVQAKVTDTLLFFFQEKAGGYGKQTYMEEAKKLSIQFYGDVTVPPITTLEECVDVYKNMDQYLGRDGERAIPVTANLVPLAGLK